MSFKKGWNNMFCKSSTSKKQEKQIAELEIKVATLTQQCFAYKIEVDSLDQVINELEKEEGSCEKENSECILFIRGISVQLSDFLNEK